MDVVSAQVGVAGVLCCVLCCVLWSLKAFSHKTQEANSMHIECAFVVFKLESGFGRCALDAHRVNPLLEVDWNQIRTEFIVYSSNNNKITHSYTPMNSNTLRLGHHTHCVCRPRYELRLPILLGCYWLDAVDKETAYQVVSRVVRQNSHSTLSTTSDKVGQVIGWSLVCASIHLEYWLDKARVEIATWAAVGVACQQQFSYISISKFWQCECDRYGFNSHTMHIG